MLGQPKGLIAAALANMGERFGYYIMNAVLVLFLCSKFGLSEEQGTVIYSVFYRLFVNFRISFQKADAYRHV